MAQAYLSEEFYVKALESARKSVELCPSWSEGHLTLARAEREMGEIVASMGSYQRVLDLDKSNVEARNEMEELRPVFERYQITRAALLEDVNRSNTPDEIEANTCIYNLFAKIRVEKCSESESTHK
jgi:tetratricopeptide (TPR) repeat protein